MKKVLFIDRDGTLIEEPADEQIDSFEKLKFVPGMFRNLGFICRNLDFEVVMVSNQDGLGTSSFPECTFWPVHNFIIKTLEGEGIHFIRQHIDNHFPEDNHPNRKPGIGMLSQYIDNPEYNMAERNTKETQVSVGLNLDGSGKCDISTGLGFFDHMLEQIGKHGNMDLTVHVKGDLYVDEHHTIEDTGLALGECLLQALGDKRGIERYGYSLPMDDCLCQVSLDFGGRPWLIWDADFHREKIGEMPTEMFYHFFKSLSDTAKMNLNIKAEGTNEHHKIEGIFKAFARALKMAVKRDIYHFQLPSSKGVL